MRGAEAILKRKTLLARRCLVKSRVPKGYRLKALDLRLRAERTRSEARLLHKAKIAGVLCPIVLDVDGFGMTLTLIRGKRPKMDAEEAHEAGGILAALHGADIIHGDYTPANLIKARNGIHVIDFGLGFISKDIEDRAVDVFTMLRALSSKEAREAFAAGYMAYPKAKSVLARTKDVEKRVRYAQ